MKNEDYIKMMMETVESAINSGQTVEHNRYCGYIAVNNNNGDEYCFQDDEYEQMMAEYEESWVSEYVDLSDYVLYMSQMW